MTIKTIKTIGEWRSEDIIHKKKKIKIGRKNIEIDKKIVSLIKTLNKFRIKTLNSCQGEKKGYISISTDNFEFFYIDNKPVLNLKFPTPKCV